MTTILCISLAIALALYLLLTKTRFVKNLSGEPKKARKQERAAIMRQLLALSEQENSVSATPPSLRSGSSNQRTRPERLLASPRGLVSSSRKS